MTRFLLLVCIVFFGTIAFGAEADYQKAWCNGRGEVEYTLYDSTRVDCLTPKRAVEFDWGYKWAESIGQALHYGRITGKRGTVALIVGAEDTRYLIRVGQIIDYYNLPLDLILIKR